MSDAISSLTDAITQLSRRIKRLEAHSPYSTPSSGGGAPANANYVVTSSSPLLTNEKILDDGDGLTLSVAGGYATMSLTTPGTITSTSVNSSVGNHTHLLSVDNKYLRLDALNDPVYGDLAIHPNTAYRLQPRYQRLTIGETTGNVATHYVVGDTIPVYSRTFSNLELDFTSDNTITGLASGDAWTDPNNARVNDGNNAVCNVVAVMGVGYSAALAATIVPGAYLPTNCVIVGAELVRKIKASADGLAFDNQIGWVLNNGSHTLFGNPGGVLNAYTSAYTTEIYGADNDPWNAKNRITGGNVNAGDVMVALQASTTGDVTLYIDYVELILYYIDRSWVEGIDDNTGEYSLQMGYDLYDYGFQFRASGQLRLPATLSIPPLDVDSTAKVVNLNADLWDSLHAPANAAGYLTNNGTGTLSWSSTATPAAHNLLSATHGDTTAAAAQVGDVITGQAGPVWARLGIGTQYSMLYTADGSTVSWSPGYIYWETAGTTITVFSSIRLHGGGFTLAVGADSGITGTLSGGGEVDTASFTGTIPITGNFAMGAGTCTSTSLNDVTVADHTHAITAGMGLLPAGTVQYQVLTTGANPYPAVWSDFYFRGTTGGTLWADVTAAKTLKLISTGDFNLTIPATGTAALATGISGGQTIYGGTAANDDLTLHGTSDATRTTSYVIIQPTAGLVGIGTSTPTAGAKLHITGSAGTGTLLVQDAIRVGDNSTVDTNSLLAFEYTVTGLATNRQGIRSFLSNNATDNSSATIRTLQIQNNPTPLSGKTFSGTHYGIDCTNLAQGAGTVTRLDGIFSSIDAQQTATITTATAIRAQIVTNSATATIETAHRAYLQRSTFSGSCTTFYGLRIDNVDQGGTNYSIYGGLGLYRFGDQLSIVGAADRQQLIVTGYTTQTNPLAQFTDAVTTAGIHAIAAFTALGSGANNDGGSILYKGKTSTTAASNMGRDQWLFINATDASYTVRRIWSTYDKAGEREGFRIESDGAAARIGFLGASAVVQQANTVALDTLLVNYGLRAAGGVANFDTAVRRTNADMRRYYHVVLESANPGGSGPSWIDANANTTGGWRLTNAAWMLRGQADVHSDWDGASDMTVGVNFMVNINNTGGGAGDTVDLKTVLYYKKVGETATRTQTVEVATIVGACAQYTQFHVDFTVDWDAVSNVITVGDVIAMVLNLETDTSEVDDVVITSMEFHYHTTHVGIESGDT